MLTVSVSVEEWIAAFAAMTGLEGTACGRMQDMAVRPAIRLHLRATAVLKFAGFPVQTLFARRSRRPCPFAPVPPFFFP
jgi:hypothetical protein